MITTMEKDDPPPLGSPKRSYAAVIQKKQSLTKYEFEISEAEGKRSIQVPAAIIEKGNPLWEDFLIARFLETAPHIAKVHVILNKIWAFGDKSQKLDVYEVDSTTMRVRIPNQMVRERIVRRGMWNIAGVPMVVSKWAPNDEDTKAKLLPLWVHLTNVPMSMYSWDGLSFITSDAGVPDRLHPETIACSNFKVAKVFVKADMTKELPTEMTYNIQGEETTVSFYYPWLPPKCTSCGKWGHYKQSCSQKSEEQAEKLGDGMVTTGMQSSSSKEGVQETSVAERVHEIEEGQILEGWKDVTPEKASRSSKMKNQSLKFGQVQIATPSRFDALSNSKEEDEIREQEKDKEMVDDETDREIEEDSSEDGKSEMEEIEGRLGREILPRQSKLKHKMLTVASNHARGKDLGKKRGARKQH